MDKDKRKGLIKERLDLIREDIIEDLLCSSTLNSEEDFNDRTELLEAINEEYGYDEYTYALYVDEWTEGDGHHG